MAVSINLAEANSILLAALRSGCAEQDEISDRIKNIIDGSHKTYRYILVNGLLAKATNNEANPIVLQAGSALQGAFDARSLCHKVLVPFERKFLNNALGGSNEPFLNKPARFPELSKNNAVRKGKDKATLLSLIRILESLDSSEEAKAYLACALKYLEEKIQRQKSLDDSVILYNPTLIEVYAFIQKFISISHEGETTVIVVAAIEKLFYSQLIGGYKVVPHKVNQSGASSKEIGDIDVYLNDTIYCAIEVKDKSFTAFDVGHAFRKMLFSGCEKGQFIYGPNTAFKVDEVRETLRRYESKSFFTYFDSIIHYARVMLFKINIADKQVFVDCLIASANQINAKQETKQWMQTCLKDAFWK